MKRVVVGLSGGVDSSVAAKLLVDKGYQVHGVYIEAYNEPGCRSDQDRRDALSVATKLGITFEVLDLKASYKTKVVDYLLTTYEAGMTPNPDIVCNGEIKFGLYLDWARENEYHYVATGHYARKYKCSDTVTQCQSAKVTQCHEERESDTVTQCQSAKVTQCHEERESDTKMGDSDKVTGHSDAVTQCHEYIQRPRDKTKDQSYFLCRVKPNRLNQILFPLGEMTKNEIRKIAHEIGLPNADKPDSMGVCMIGEFSMEKFLRTKIGEKPGKVFYNNQIIGVHPGLWFATLGQRTGKEIKLDPKLLRKAGLVPEKLPALYVVGKRHKENELWVGERRKCYTDKISVAKINWYMDYAKLMGEKRLFVRIRNLGELNLVLECQDKGKTWVITTSEKMFAPASGQVAVFYAKVGEEIGGEIVVGEGTIDESFFGV